MRAGSDAPFPGVEVFKLDSGPELKFSLELALASGQALEDFARRRGRRFVSDGEGRCRVPEDSSESALWLAFAPGWSGVGRAETLPRIELFPELTLSAIVLDANGETVSGIPVTLLSRWSRSDRELLRARTDERGRARMTVPHQLLERGPDVEILLAVTGLFKKPVELPYDLERGSEPLVLRLRPYGFVDVSVAGGDGPLPPAILELRRVIDGRVVSSGGALPYAVEAGRARLGPVGLDLELEISGQSPGSRFFWRAEARGPKQAGETVEVLLRAPPILSVAGRALGPDGEALSGLALVAAWKEEDAFRATWFGSLGGRLWTDEEGRFIWDLPEEAWEGGSASLTVERMGMQLSATLDIPAAGPGILDLGDVRLDPPPLLVAGTLVDPAGRPLAGVQLEVEARPEGPERAEFRAVEGRAARSSDQGAFEIRGPAPEGRLRIVARVPGRPLLAQPFVAGQDGLRLVLEEGAALRGEIRFDPQIDAAGSIVHLLSIGNTYEEAELDSQGRFELHGMHAGRYDLVLFNADWIGGPLTLSEGLMLDADSDATRSHRTFDARGKLTVTRVRIETSEGRLVDEVEIESRSTEPGSGPPQRRATRAIDGEHVWIAADATLEVGVSAPGFRPDSLRLSGGERRLVLWRGPAVELLLEGLEHLPPGIQVGVRLRPRAAGSAAILGEARNGSVRLALDSPGIWIGNVTLRQQDGNWRSVRWGQSLHLKIEDVHGTQRVTIPLETSTYRRAAKLAGE